MTAATRLGHLTNIKLLGNCFHGVNLGGNVFIVTAATRFEGDFLQTCICMLYHKKATVCIACLHGRCTCDICSYCYNTISENLRADHEEYIQFSSHKGGVDIACTGSTLLQLVHSKMLMPCVRNLVTVYGTHCQAFANLTCIWQMQ